jgi:hypothetical protein
MKFTAILIAFFLTLFAFPASAAGPQSWTTSARCVKSVSINPGGGVVTYNDIATIQGLECLFFNVLQVIVFIAGLAFLFMFISGGFKYLLSSGEQKAVAAASSTLTMAFIGLIGIIASWLIISFIQKFTGVNVTQFIIPS